jgi:hypothetical protein
MQPTKKNRKAESNRKHIRFNPDMGDIAWINGKTPGLIVNESYTGCSLIVLSPAEVEKGDVVQVQVGKLKTMESEVRWVKKIDSYVVRIGLLYMD